MRVRWTKPAVDQLTVTGAFIAERNPIAAKQIERRLRAAVEALAQFPLMAQAGRVPGTRELNVPGTPYVIPYRIDGEWVDILALFHGAQRRDLR